MTQVRIEECEGKFALINFPDGGRTKLTLDGNDVPLFDTASDANEWACDHDYDVTNSVPPKPSGDGETCPDDSCDKSDSCDEAEKAKDDKALSNAHLHELEKYYNARVACRLERAIGRLSDEELEAEIARKRK